MCDKVLEVDPWSLYDVPDLFKTQQLCGKAVKDDLSSLQFIADWFFAQQQIDLWHDDDYWYDDDEMIEWYDSYKNARHRKQK